ncbi:MAG: hypothetical protein ACFFFT_00660 [Candidatus Thorarchaeota archaeon]
MTENIDLKDLEKRAWRSTFQDGLWDIYMGLLFMGLGIYTIRQDNIFIAMVILILWVFGSFLVFYLGKRMITIPRMGFVKFGETRKSKKIKLSIFLSIMVLINIIFLFLRLFGLNINLNSFITMLSIGILFITLPICIVAYFLEFERLYAIAIMGGLCFPISELLRPIVGFPLNSILSFCIIGCVIVIWGFFYFIRFLKEYPLPKDDQKLEVTNV